MQQMLGYIQYATIGNEDAPFAFDHRRIRTDAVIGIIPTVTNSLSTKVE